MHDLILEFDGGCEPVNPGGLAIGSFLLRSPDGKIIESGATLAASYSPQATNNTAEFTGLLLGLETVVERSWPQHLKITGDSEVVIRWFLQRRCVIKPNPKAPHLEPIKLKIRDILLADDRQWTAEHVLREYNSDADRIGREYMETLEPFDAGKLWPDHWWNHRGKK